ncbi:MAG TPA: CAAX prenyl protease-related protein [Methylophilaceae bacterium]|nr:CAAX prenyl protease-related protein [Methylophilaceae bacterium]
MRLSMSIVARTIPFAYYLLLMAISDFMADAGLDVRWVYGIRAGGTALLLWYFRHEYCELVGLAKPKVSEVLFAVLAGLLVFVLWINLNQSWMVIGTSTGYDPHQANGELNYGLITMRLTGAALVVPVMEELFWRSFIMRWLDSANFTALLPANISVRALVLSSAVFAIEHTFWLAGLLAGLIYGLLYIRAQKLWVAIVAHAVTNGVLGVWVLYTHQWNYW